MICRSNGVRSLALIAIAVGVVCMHALPLEAQELPIIGGAETDGFPEVVYFTSSAGACTGTLVGRRLVLTAAHCVTTGPEDVAQGGTVRFGPNTSEFTDSVGILRNLPHRRYQFGAVTRFDIAFARLAMDAPAELTPYVINLEPITDADIGMQVRVIGFGLSDGTAQTGAGTKREIALTVEEVTSQHIGFGNSAMNICQGDSGGPTTIFGPDGPTVLAVSSFGTQGCRDRSFVARSDAFPDFVSEVLSAWGDGPCAVDGTCNSECTEFLDPDCDICGLDGVCATGCPKVDLDCPLGGAVGELCGDSDACEDRQCIEASDDPRIKYCSVECDDADPAIPDCAIPLTCVSNMCRYVEPTPSAQGAACNAASDCRSQLCDLANEICVEPCTTDSECGDAFECGDVEGAKACTIPTEGSCLGCGLSGSWGDIGGNGVLLILLLIGYGAAARRRRSLKHL